MIRIVNRPLTLAALAAAVLVAQTACAQEEGGKQEESKAEAAAPQEEAAPPAGEGESTEAETHGKGDAAIMQQIDQFIASQKIDKSKNNWKLQLPKPPMLTFDAKQKVYWNLETNVGSIKVRLMPEFAPMHVSSTVYLTRLGFYDAVPFHRVITQFMAQGGDPTGTGRSGPGYKYDGEFDPAVKHDRPGLLSMANAGPGTDGSQFFLTFVATPWLDGKHTIFGEVVSGMDTVKTLEKNGSQGGTPKSPLEIKTATISVE